MEPTGRREAPPDDRLHEIRGPRYPAFRSAPRMQPFLRPIESTCDHNLIPVASRSPRLNPSAARRVKCAQCGVPALASCSDGEGTRSKGMDLARTPGIFIHQYAGLPRGL